MPDAAERLAQVLISEGIVSPRQAAEALRERGPGRPLVECLVARGYATRERILEAAAKHGVSAEEEPSKPPLRVAERKPPGTTRHVPKVKPDGPPQEVLDARRDPKRVFGKYTIVHELGRGGMAVVYKAWDDGLAQYVALKLIRGQDPGASDAPTEQQVREFLREARMTVRLSHANVVRVYELGQHEGRWYLSMEYIDGPTLAQLIHAGADKGTTTEFYKSPRRFVGILRDVAHGVEHAHRQDPPILHRDLKPGNILVGAGDRAKVVDFGLARELQGDDGRLTMSGVAKGTPCYMAPEQAAGGELTPRTDVWGLGGILYEMLTGVPPFRGKSSHEIVHRVANEDVAPPSSVVRGHRPPRDLEAVCLKALDRDASRRHATAREFADDLDRHLRGEAVHARAAGPLDRAWRTVRRHRAAAVASGVAAVMAIVAVVALATRGGTTKVIVKEGPSAKLADALKKVDEIADGDKAERAYRELLAAATEEQDRRVLETRLVEVRRQKALLRGLVERVRKAPRDYERLALVDDTLAEVRVLDATEEALFVRFGGRATEVPWPRVRPSQFVQIVKDYWPDVSGEARLGLGIYCVRRQLPNEAILAFRGLRGTEWAEEARRYLAELRADLGEGATGAPAKADSSPVVRPPTAGRSLAAAYADHRELFVAAMRARRLAEAASSCVAIGRRFGTNAGSFCESAAVASLAKGTTDAAALTRLLGEIETWLAAATPRDDASLSVVLDVRDLAHLALFILEAESALDALAKGRTAVSMETLTAVPVRASRGAVFDGRMLVVTGSGTHLTARDLLAIVAAKRGGRAPDVRERLSEGVLLAYSGEPAAARLAGMSRLDDALRLGRVEPLEARNLLPAGSLTLRGSEGRARETFAPGVLCPGVRLRVEARVEEASDPEAVLQVGVQGADEKWTCVASLHVLTGRVSIDGPKGERASGTATLGRTRPRAIGLELAPMELRVTVDGTVAARATLREDVRGTPAIAAALCRVRLDRVEIADAPESATPAPTLECSSTSAGHAGSIEAVAVSWSGERVATAGADGRVMVRSVVGDGKPRERRHGAAVTCLAWSRDDAVVAWGDVNGTVQFWNLEDGSDGGAINAHGAAVAGAAFTEAGTLLVTAGRDGEVHVWDWRRRALERSLSRSAPVTALAWTSDTIVVAGDAAGEAQMVDAANGTSRLQLQASRGGVTAVASAGEVLAVAGADGVRLLSRSLGVARATIAVPGARAVAISADGRHVAAAFGDGTVRVFDATTGAAIETAVVPGGHPRSLAFSRLGVLLTGCGDGALRVWKSPIFGSAAAPDRPPPSPRPKPNAEEMSAQELCDEGWRRAQKKDWAGAIDAFDRSLEADPAMRDAYRGRAWARMMRREYEAAVADYTRAIERSDDADTRRSRSRAHRALGRFDKALADLDAALRMDPRNAETYVDRAYVARDMGDMPTAVTDAESAVRLNPSLGAAYQVRGILAYEAGRFSVAVTDLLDAVEKGGAWKDYAFFYVWCAEGQSAGRAAATLRLKEWRRRRAKVDDEEWVTAILEFMCRERSEALLMAAALRDAGVRKERECEAYFYAGVSCLIDGDRDGARRRFEKCVALGVDYFIEHGSAKAWLAR